MIDLQPSSEQEQIIASVAALLSDRLPPDRLRANPAGPAEGASEANRDVAEWRRIGELGVFGLGLSVDEGGIGYTLVEEVLVAREFGRFMLSPSVVATMLAAHLAAAIAEADLLAQIQSGGVPVAQAVAGTFAAEEPIGSHHLLDGEGATWCLAWYEHGLALVPVTALLDRESLVAIDTSVTLERVRLADLAGVLHVRDEALLRRGRLLVSAYLVGLAEGALEDSVGYAKLREQFGQPIGAFQAVKHRCADMIARASAAWNLTVFAALADVEGAPDATFQSIAARIMASDAAFRNAAVNLQNHGGIGFTREHQAHLYVKRAHMFDLIGGSAAIQKKRLLAIASPFDAA